MKKGKVLISMLVIVVALGLAFGATMAFFTDDIQAPTNTFQAGTVEIENGQEIVTPADMGNVNPGDCFEKCFTIINTGSKAIELRMTGLTGVWSFDGVASGLPLLYEDGPLYIAPVGDDWKMRRVGNGFEFYYTGGPIASGEEVQLCIIVAFDGPKMDDRYQGITLELNGTFDAVQASNDAPESVWSDANWVAWNEPGGWFSLNHYDALVYSMGAAYANYYDTTKCFNGNGDIIIENYGEHYVGIEDRLDLDFDYNDFGMTFNLTERYVKGDDDVERLKSITMVFNSVAYLAGDNHDIKLDHLGLSGLDYEYTITRGSAAFGSETPAGTYQSTDKPLSDVVLYDTAQYTAQTVQMNEQVTISLQLGEPTALPVVDNPRPGLDVVDLEEGLWYYNFVLENKTVVNTFDMTTISTSNGIGYKAPFIIVVPKPGFIPPEDQAKIDTVYADFENYYKTGIPTDWYNNITDSSKLAW